ncbi:MAG: Hint domain-containing protein, partial [Halocynthiibacter sp.]
GTAKGTADLRKRAARRVGRLGRITPDRRVPREAHDNDAPLIDARFVVTDGRRSYTILLIELADRALPLLMTLDELPPRDTDLWIANRASQRHNSNFSDVTPDAQFASSIGGVICFTPGTRLDTPDGPRLIEDLAEGDQVLTCDRGAQEIRWIGKRRMSGARLYAMPHLRPVRIRAGALGEYAPHDDLVVSPDHRVLLCGPQARALFNTQEVLVAAKDLINDSSILVENGKREVTYIHLALEQHNLVWANGLRTESFHPASAAADAIAADDRARLLKIFPQVGENPYHYGEYARRSLSAPEATLLRHAGSAGRGIGSGINAGAALA